MVYMDILCTFYGRCCCLFTAQLWRVQKCQATMRAAMDDLRKWQDEAKNNIYKRGDRATGTRACQL